MPSVVLALRLLTQRSTPRVPHRPYADCTWESCRTLVTEQSAIRRYWANETPPTAAEARMAQTRARPPKSAFKKIVQSPSYKAGHGLRPYQLEGLNWLLFSWYNRRSVLLADEMGLGKTVQSVTTVNHIWKVENIRGPFLVLAPLSTLSHWQREFDGWTDMNTIVYHGSYESREIIREFEFYYTAPGATASGSAPPCKFHTLITSFEVIKQDLAIFRKIPWRCASWPLEPPHHTSGTPVPSLPRPPLLLAPCRAHPERSVGRTHYASQLHGH